MHKFESFSRPKQALGTLSGTEKARLAPRLLCFTGCNQQVPLCRSGPVCFSMSAACAAASLAVSNRKGEQLT